MIGGFWRSRAQSGRELADMPALAQHGDDGPPRSCKGETKGSPQLPAYCQDRYPSPRRFDRPAIGPTPLCRVVPAGSRQIRSIPARAQMTVVFPRKRSDSARRRTNQEKGSPQCSNSVSSSPVWRSPASRPVLTTTSNAVSPGQLAAPLSPTPSAAILSPARSSVAPAARFATNSRDSAADLIAPVTGVRPYPTAVPGDPRCGGLAFEGP